jgi:S-adenosylmethionine:tRNA ribosyltransferase-isomerase
MRLADLQYELPEELIAQQPAQPRDASRLMVLHRDTGRIEHRIFRDIVNYLESGDCLVRNDTRVIPARFFCRRESGGRIEALFLRDNDGLWRVLLRPSARLNVGERLAIEGHDRADVVVPDAAAGAPGPADGAQCHSPATGISEGGAILVLRARHERGEWSVEPDPADDPIHMLDRVGQPPLPPYIHRSAAPTGEDRWRYQTVYAATPGAVAAPTAGLHFTRELLEAIGARGVGIADVTLHVGLGTFAPIAVDDLADHPMHSEWYDVPESTADALNAAGGDRVGHGEPRAGESRADQSKRIVAVGTTSLRVLESLPPGPVHASRGWTDLFIYPPHEFKRVGALLTNFHVPGSTLLALVMALGGVENIRAAYKAAMAERYRFFSYGDAMLIC